MINWRGVWQWLFRRHTPQRPAPFVSPAMSCWLVVNRHYTAIEAEIAADPWMREPDLKTSKTARITRVIDARTIPIASIASEETQVSHTPYAFYAEHTMADAHATQPLRM